MDGRVRPRGHCDPRANGRPYSHPDRLHPSAEEPDEGDQGCRLPGRLGRLQRHHSNPGQSTGDRELLDDLVRPGSVSAADLPPLSSREKLVRSYLLMIYGLFERVYILHEKRWIDDASWREWATWIEVMCRNPIFTHVHTISRGMFNASFQDRKSTRLNSSH